MYLKNALDVFPRKTKSDIKLIVFSHVNADQLFFILHIDKKN